MDGIVYIDADAEVCYNRIKKRSRDGESNISLDYLEKCKKYYDDWLDSVRLKIDILDINANYDTKYNMQDENDKGVEWLLKIHKYINTRKNAAIKGECENKIPFMNYVEAVMDTLR